MKLRTKSIIDQIELELDKDINEINDDDLLHIKSLFINGVDILSEYQFVYIDDIKLFNNLESIVINNMEIDDLILDTLKNINSLRSIVFNRCEILDFPCVFYNVLNVEFDFCDNFNDDILNSFPNISDLTLKGCNIGYIPKSVKRLNIPKCSVSNYEIFNKLELDDLFISLDEYNRNVDLYKSLNAKVYDNNDCYIDKVGN